MVDLVVRVGGLDLDSGDPLMTLWKGLILTGTPIRIPNDRAPNHQFTSSLTRWVLSFPPIGDITMRFSRAMWSQLWVGTGLLVQCHREEKMNHLNNSVGFQCLYPRGKVNGTTPIYIALFIMPHIQPPFLCTWRSSLPLPLPAPGSSVSLAIE